MGSTTFGSRGPCVLLGTYPMTSQWQRNPVTFGFTFWSNLGTVNFLAKKNVEVWGGYCYATQASSTDLLASAFLLIESGVSAQSL